MPKINVTDEVCFTGLLGRRWRVGTHQQGQLSGHLLKIQLWVTFTSINKSKNLIKMLHITKIKIVPKTYQKTSINWRILASGLGYHYYASLRALIRVDSKCSSAQLRRSIPWPWGLVAVSPTSLLPATVRAIRARMQTSLHDFQSSLPGQKHSFAHARPFYHNMVNEYQNGQRYETVFHKNNLGKARVHSKANFTSDPRSAFPWQHPLSSHGYSSP